MTEGIQVLYIEDDPQFADLTARYLEREYDQLATEIASSVEEGRETLSGSSFDCIVCDYDLPDQTGLEFLGDIRGEYSRLPFILFTGKGSEEVASEALSKGATDYLQKGGPETLELLAKRIVDSVHDQQLRQLKHVAKLDPVTLLDRITDALVALDQDWSITMVNDSAETMLNAPADALLGTTIWESIPGIEDTQFARAYRDAMETGEPTTVEGYIDAWDRWYRQQLYPAADGLSIISQDITDKKRRQLRLQQTGRRFEAIMDDPNVLLAFLTPAGEVITVNQTALDYVGTPAAEIEGTSFWETPWWPTEERENLQSLIDRAAAGEYVTYSAPHLDDVGEPFFVEGTIRPVTDDANEVVSLIASARDVTERRERERRYRTLIENLPGMVYRGHIDRTWTWEVLEGDCEALTGYSCDELLSAVDFGQELIHPDDREAVYSDVVAAAKSGSSFELTYRIERADGREQWIWERGREVEPGIIEGFMTDITDRIENERELQSLKDRLELAIDAANLGIWDWDMESETVQYNANWARMLGYSPEEIEPTYEAWRRLVHPEDYEQIREELDELIDGKVTEFEAEYRMQTADGTWRWIRDIGRTVEDENGHPTRAVGIHLDITEAKAYERKLRRSRDLLRHTERIAQTGGWEADVETGTQRWTSGTYRIHAVDPETFEPTVEAGLAFFHPDDRDTIERQVTRCMTAGESYDDEHRIITADGDIRWVRTTGEPIRDGGEITAIRGAIRDITERKAHEEQLKRQNDRLDDFAQVVSHDLRNPLTVASGRLELAQRERSSEHLDAVETALNRMDELIDSLLTFARHGEPVSERTTVDLQELVRDCWQTVHAPSADLELSTTRVVRADRSRLRQLFENLIRNAVEHGGGSVTIEVGDLPEGFFVEDDGPGISVDEYERVFESGYSTTVEGPGFGLAIVNEIVEAHGWQIELTESAAGGARFEIITE